MNNKSTPTGRDAIGVFSPHHFSRQGLPSFDFLLQPFDLLSQLSQISRDRCHQLARS